MEWDNKCTKSESNFKMQYCNLINYFDAELYHKYWEEINLSLALQKE